MMPRNIQIRRLPDGVVFNSIREAAESVYVTPSAVSLALLRDGTAGGHRWQRVADIEPEPEPVPEPDPMTIPKAIAILREIDALVEWEKRGGRRPADSWRSLRHIWRTHQVRERLNAIG